MLGRGVHELHNRKRLQAWQPHGRDCKWSIGRSCLQTPPLAGAVGPHDDSTRMLWSTGLHRLYKPGELSWSTLGSTGRLPGTRSHELREEGVKVQDYDGQFFSESSLKTHRIWIVSCSSCTFYTKRWLGALLKLPHEIFGALVRDSPTHPTSTPATVTGKSNNNHARLFHFSRTRMHTSLWQDYYCNAPPPGVSLVSPNQLWLSIPLTQWNP